MIILDKLLNGRQIVNKIKDEDEFMELFTNFYSDNWIIGNFFISL